MQKDPKNKLPKHIFIAGCGRSGTTFLQTVIDSHPCVFIPSESLFIVDYLKYGSYVPNGLLSRLFFSEPQLKSWYEGPRFRFKDAVDAITKTHKYMAKKVGASIWGQKTPRFIRSMELFDANFQESKWILIHRDPRAVVASMLKSKQHTYSIRIACRRWKKDNQSILNHKMSKNKSINILIVQYEELITNFEFVLEEIFVFLNIKQIKREDIIKNGKIPKYKGSKFENNAIREGLRPRVKFVENWKNVLSRKQIEYIEKRCRAEMSAFGYRPISSYPRHSKQSCMDSTLSIFRDFLIIVEYLYRWPSYLFFFSLRKVLFWSIYILRIIEGRV